MTSEVISRRSQLLLPIDMASAPNLLIVDARWSVVMASATDIWGAAGVTVQIGRTIPLELQAIVDSAMTSLTKQRSNGFCVRVSPWPDIAVTIYAVESAGEQLVALVAHAFRARKNLRHAQRTYGLSRRELEILQHVLSGAATSRIAAALNIADSTVIAHVKSLLIKTKAANRAALVARVLGWEETLTP